MKKCFFTGLVTLLPLAITIWVIHFVVRFLTKPFMGFVTHFVSRLPTHGIFGSETVLRTLSQIIILIALFLITFFLGFVARRYFFGKLIKLSEKVLHKIPLVNKLYKTSKEIVRSLFGPNQNSFSQAVMLPFPYHGSYCIGLIARTAPKTCSDTMEKEMLSVFVPTTPNPTTGFLVMCERSELIYLDMSSEDAIKYIVSCAVIQPGNPS